MLSGPSIFRKSLNRVAFLKIYFSREFFGYEGTRLQYGVLEK